MRFIEESFPIDLVSSACAKEKSVRQGHISTLQTWWARRPLAVCRTMIFLSLIPDANTLKAHKEISSKLLSLYPESSGLQEAVNLFAGELSQWSNHDNQKMISLANDIIKNTNDRIPKILDSFAGGGSIPLEGLRLGLNTSGVELNPIAANALKFALELLPGSSEELLESIHSDFNRFSQIIKKVSEKHYGVSQKEQVSALFWSRTYSCPQCGFEVPLLQNKWLAKKPRNFAIKLTPRPREKEFSIEIYAPIETSEINDANTGTIHKRNACCPNCEHNVSTKYIQELGKKGLIGEKLYAKYVADKNGNKTYKIPSKYEYDKYKETTLNRNAKKWINDYFDIKLDLNGVRHIWAIQYGVESVKDLFSVRQYNVLVDVLYELNKFKSVLQKETENNDDFLRRYIPLVLTINRLSIYSNRHSWWQSNGEFPANIFVRQAIPMVWNYVEIPPSTEFAGGWKSATTWLMKVIKHISKLEVKGTVNCCDAASMPFKNNTFDLVAIDPPYFDSVTYSYLSDFFYAWMKPLLNNELPDWFSGICAPKKNELIVDRPHSIAPSPKNSDFFEEKMTSCLNEIDRVLSDDGLVTLMFGHKKIEVWNLLFNSLKKSGFAVVASWAIHMERKSKFKHSKVDALSSSCILVLKKHNYPINPKKISSKEFTKILRKVIKNKQKDSDDNTLDPGDKFMKYFAPSISESLNYQISKNGEEYTIYDLLEDIQGILMMKGHS